MSSFLDILFLLLPFFIDPAISPLPFICFSLASLFSLFLSFCTFASLLRCGQQISCYQLLAKESPVVIHSGSRELKHKVRSNLMTAIAGCSAATWDNVGNGEVVDGLVPFYIAPCRTSSPN
jgi:hypothetical protein